LGFALKDSGIDIYMSKQALNRMLKTSKDDQFIDNLYKHQQTNGKIVFRLLRGTKLCTALGE